MKSTRICCLVLVACLASVPDAQAKPCCETCDGWPLEPPAGPDYCWDSCMICNNVLVLCNEHSQCASELWQCIVNRCVFVGTPVGDPEPPVIPPPPPPPPLDIAFFRAQDRCLDRGSLAMTGDRAGTASAAEVDHLYFFRRCEGEWRLEGEMRFDRY